VHERSICLEGGSEDADVDKRAARLRACSHQHTGSIRCDLAERRESTRGGIRRDVPIPPSQAPHDQLCRLLTPITDRWRRDARRPVRLCAIAAFAPFDALNPIGINELSGRLDSNQRPPAPKLAEANPNSRPISNILQGLSRVDWHRPTLAYPPASFCTSPRATMRTG
jgi:hypothetical protein